MQLSDLESVNSLTMQSWLDTYVNEEFGVTREWIEQFWADKAGDDKEALGWKLEHEKMNFLVATDNNGELVARSSQIVLPNGVQLIRTMYIDKRFHGSGLADRLMKAMIDWFDNAKPIELGVTTFNQRAKNFYKKWGFEEVELFKELKFGKLPEIKMIRVGEK